METPKWYMLNVKFYMDSRPPAPQLRSAGAHCGTAPWKSGGNGRFEHEVHV